MVDDFLDMQDSSSFLDELEAEESAPPAKRTPKRKRRRSKSKRKRKRSKSSGFFGLTSKQTFIISALLFFLVCSVGLLFMLISGKMVLTI